MSVRPIRAGELRHRVILQSRIAARTAQGGFTYTWNNVRTISAKIEPKSGRETYFSDAVLALASHVIEVRVQSSTVTPDMRLTFGTRIFNIVQALLVDEIKHRLVIAATEIPGSAETATGSTNLITTYQTDEISFLTTHDIDKPIPTGFRFYPDSVEIVCTSLTGVVSIQPTIRAGILGNLTKYLTKLPTLITAANLRQGYSGLSTNAGETDFRLGISVAGALSSGSVYKGRILVKGVLIPT